MDRQVKLGCYFGNKEEFLKGVVFARVIVNVSAADEATVDYVLEEFLADRTYHIYYINPHITTNDII